MDFFLNILLSDINKSLIFGIMRDFRIGGLNPDNYDKFMRFVNKVPNIVESYQTPSEELQDFMAITEPSAAIRTKIMLIQHNLAAFNLKPVTKVEVGRIWNRVTKIVEERTQFCWHPEASDTQCAKDENGKVKITSAHSIQRSKILKHISEDNKIKQIKQDQFNPNIDKLIRAASTFYGFCNTHDAVFNPIERQDYSETAEQNFLFAYRAFVHSSHVKLSFFEYNDFGEQAKNDISRCKEIFDASLVTADFSRIKTDLIVLNYEYPLTISFASDLEFDYRGEEIAHSDDRMEMFYMTVLPQSGKTYILFSYFLEDKTLYGDIFNQIKQRKSIESDLSILIAGHCENTFFKPSYYEKYIASQEQNINKLTKQTQFDFVPYDGFGKESNPITLTPANYLENEFGIQLFFKE